MHKKSSFLERVPARQRLLDAAESLFYVEGFNVVGIDRVIERAGVAKASLYDCFGSKDGLILAYLLAKQESRRTKTLCALDKYSKPEEKLLGIFELLDGSTADPSFRGCAFIKAGVEAREGSTVKAACDDAREWLRRLFAELANEAGLNGPESLANQLVMIYDGASVAAHIDQNRSAAIEARSVVESLLLAAGKKRQSRVRQTRACDLEVTSNR